MSTKNISLREEAYERLKALKTEEKSFSDVVLELTGDGDLREQEITDGKEEFKQLIGMNTNTTTE